LEGSVEAARLELVHPSTTLLCIIQYSYLTPILTLHSSLTRPFHLIPTKLQEDIYGLGKVRTPEKFYETFGIDVVKKKAAPRLCMFVETGKMHRQFMPKLRSDGMGIDYSTVKYKHK